jgi:glutamyl-Q tRNA(Asp) synthetase
VYGFEWDGEVLYQSTSKEAHDEAVRLLVERDLAYPCGCSRKDLADAPRGPLGTIYPGTCRNGCRADETALRVRTTDEPISFTDALQGPQVQRIESESGDFIIRRRDGLIAYQLAVVVDDEVEGITDVVRGIDIMESTPRQIWLQRLLGYHTPSYLHFPVITHADGDKLSKATGAPGVSIEDVRPTLVAALEALLQAPPPDLAACTVPEIWSWATQHWKIEPLQGVTAVRADKLSVNILTGTPELP